MPKVLAWWAARESDAVQGVEVAADGLLGARGLGGHFAQRHALTPTAESFQQQPLAQGGDRLGHGSAQACGDRPAALRTWSMEIVTNEVLPCADRTATAMARDVLDLMPMDCRVSPGADVGQADFDAALIELEVDGLELRGIINAEQ